MNKNLGAQLYTIRDYCDTKENFAKAMEKVKNIGYKYVQISGIKVDDAEFIKETCDKNGLEIICTHRPYDSFIDDFDTELERHKIYGSKYAGVGGLRKGIKETKELFFETIDNLNRVYDKLQEHGITFTYHNHEWEFRKFDDGKSYMDYIIERGKFSLLVDVYWLSFSGINPVKFIKEHGDRIECIHFKDLKIKPDKCEVAICEVGRGNLDWDEIIAACEEADVKYVFVEQDTCETDSIECLETSYKFLSEKGFN